MGQTIPPDQALATGGKPVKTLELISQGFGVLVISVGLAWIGFLVFLTFIGVVHW